MAKIVVIGGSFGGLTAAFELKRLLGSRADITLISDSDKFVFVPSLPWVSLGLRKPEDISLDLNSILTRKGIVFKHAEAKAIDAVSSKVITDTGELAYDYLVISTGPALAFNEVPGFDPKEGRVENIFTLPLALNANKAWQRFLESPGPVATGSVQAVSCFGPPYEYAFEIDAILRRRGMRHKAPITFITSEPYIGHFGIGGFGESKIWLETEFAKRDIKIIVNAAVEEFAPGEARLKDGTKIPFKLSMFAPAMKGVPAVAALGNPRGFIPVDGQMRHKSHKNIFAVGVAIAIAPPEPTPVPTGVPKTGYMTVKMALTAAKAIASEIKGSALPPAYDMDVLCLMDMGDTAAYMSAHPLLPPRQSIVLKQAKWAKWMKIWFERYFMFKMKRGLSNWP